MRSLSRLDLTILFEIQKKPRLQKTAICRKLNDRFKFYCSLRRCFANIRKKRTRTTFPCECQYSRNRIVGSLKKLEEKDLIAIRREKVPDSHNNRGWDLMLVSYSQLNIVFGRMDLVGSPLETEKTKGLEKWS